MKQILPAILVLSSLVSFAQTGGQKSFEFLNVANNARLAALGGVNASLTDRDLNFFYSNPALVSDSLAGFASATYQFYVADVGQSTVSYAHKFKNIGTLLFGVQHLSYGTMQGYDASGMEIGTFKSGETAIVIGKSRGECEDDLFQHCRVSCHCCCYRFWRGVCTSSSRLAYRAGGKKYGNSFF